MLRRLVTPFRGRGGRLARIASPTRALYAEALYKDAGATLDDLRESVRTFEEIEPSARRVLGGAHPITMQIEDELQHARPWLRAREATQPSA